MKIAAQNRRARYDYEILDTVEAGVVLTGTEVKACRQGHVQLPGSYVSFQSGKPILKNVKITKYRMSGLDVVHEETRDRELLLKGPEAEKLRREVEEKGITLIPLEVRAGRFIKILLGLGRGKKKYDKRVKIREREERKSIRENPTF